jgi:hypothetical protein
MRELSGVVPLVRRRDQIEPISALTMTVGDYYEEKRRRYRLNLRGVYERDLRRLFHDRGNGARGLPAASYLRDARPAIRDLVVSTTGAPRYDVDRLLRQLIHRSADLDLVVAGGAARANGRHTRRVAAQLARYLAEGHAALTR